MSVNICENGVLTPIAGNYIAAPTPDYVDAQYNSTKTYSKDMTCILGNVRYRYKNSTATSGHRPPNATYWEVLSVSDQLNTSAILKVFDFNNYQNGAYVIHETVLQNISKFSTFILIGRQTSNNIDSYNTCCVLPKSVFALSTTVMNWRFTWGADIKLQFQVKYVDDTHVDVVYKDDNGNTVTGMNVVLIGIN